MWRAGERGRTFFVGRAGAARLPASALTPTDELEEGGLPTDAEMEDDVEAATEDSRPDIDALLRSCRVAAGEIGGRGGGGGEIDRRGILLPLGLVDAERDWSDFAVAAPVV